MSGRNRVPAGAPGGGQFAPTERPRPGLSLDKLADIAGVNPATPRIHPRDRWASPAAISLAEAFSRAEVTDVAGTRRRMAAHLNVDPDAHRFDEGTQALADLGGQLQADDLAPDPTDTPDSLAWKIQAGVRLADLTQEFQAGATPPPILVGYHSYFETPVLLSDPLIVAAARRAGLTELPCLFAKWIRP